MKILPYAILALLAIAPAALAANVTYSTNFDNTTDFVAGETLSSYTTSELPANNPDQNLDWITSNTLSDASPTAEPTDSILADSSSYAEYAGDQWAIMGGLVGSTPSVPSQSNVELWNPVSITGKFNFSMEFGVTSSGVSYPNNDSFGVTFRDTSSDLLFQILFVPDLTNPTTKLDVDWNTGGGETSAGFAIFKDAKYDIAVSGTLGSGNFLSVISEVGASSSGTFNGSFTGTSNPLGEAGVTWDIANSGAPGSNSILFNNYAIVPEPSEVASLLLGGAGLLCWLRRKRSLG